MGQPASTIDWSEESGAFRVIEGSGSESAPAREALRADSAVYLKSPVAWEPEQEEADDDEPTRPYVRATLSLPVPDAVADLDRATGCATVRLGALLEWIADEEPTSEVVRFVRAFLGDLGALNQALYALMCATRASPSVAFRTTAEAFLGAAGVWRAHLVDHVDDLALLEHRTLDGWSGLPQYSAMYMLAFVLPALDAIKDWTTVSRVETVGVALPLAAVESAIAELNWTLRSAAAKGAIGDVARLETAGRAIAR